MDGKTYLLVVDYFSRYVKVQTLSTTTSASVIKALKAVFPRHGIPSTLVSDKGPQYSPQEFANFSREYNSPTQRAANATRRVMTWQRGWSGLSGAFSLSLQTRI